MQELIILFIKYKFFILATVLTGLHIFFVVKRRSYKKQIRNQVLLVKQLLKTNDSNRPVSQNINLFHQDLSKQIEIAIWIKQSWESFYQVFHRNQMAGNSMIPLVEDHFDEYEFTQELGNRNVLALLPGVFLTIGILTTFLGLTLATYGLDVQSSNQMSYLISGIGFAFVGSIIAIGLSLYWQLSDHRTYYPFLLQQYDELLDTLQHAFPSNESTFFLEKIVETQKSQMEDFKTFLSETFIQNFVHQIGSTLHFHLKTTQSMMKETLNETAANQVADLDKMGHQLVESLGKITEEPIQELRNTLYQTVQWQEKAHSDMTELLHSLQESVSKQVEIGEKTTDLTTMIQQNASHLSEYQSVLQLNISELNETTNKHRELQIVFMDLLEKITAERQQIQQQLSEQLQQIDQRSVQLKEHWSDTHLMIKEVNEQLGESTDRFVQHMHSGLEQTFIQFDTALTNSVNSLASGVGTLETLFQELPTQVEQLNDHVSEINNKLSKAISDANQSIIQAIREVQRQTEVLSQKSWS